MNQKILTLVIIHKGDKILLGLKKRGFGIGKWNGFGGKVHEGEAIEEAAKRELFEESGLTTDSLKKLGVLDFSWKAKEGVLQVHIFKSNDVSGVLTESEEMKPQWFLIKDIPYGNMWSDDKYWLPLFLENKKFKGTFVFNENNHVAEYQLHEES